MNILRKELDIIFFASGFVIFNYNIVVLVRRRNEFESGEKAKQSPTSTESDSSTGIRDSPVLPNHHGPCGHQICNLWYFRNLTSLRINFGDKLQSLRPTVDTSTVDARPTVDGFLWKMCYVQLLTLGNKWKNIKDARLYLYSLLKI